MEHICFYLASWGPKKGFYLWSAQSSKVLVMANRYGPLQKEKEKCECTKELINMNHTISNTWPDYGIMGKQQEFFSQFLY